MRDFKDLKIAVAGTGYVGLSIATLLSQHHKVMAVDIVPEKVELINNKKSPIQDEYIEKYLAEKELDLTATLDAKEAYSDADFVVIAAPTNVYSTNRIGRRNVKKNLFCTLYRALKLVVFHSHMYCKCKIFIQNAELLAHVAQNWHIFFRRIIEMAENRIKQQKSMSLSLTSETAVEYTI